jgi:hypothetical protein
MGSAVKRHLESILFSTIAALGVAACGQGSAPDPTDSHGASGEALQVSPGVTVTSATYHVHNDDGFSSAGTVPVGDSPDVSVTLSGVPVATGYEMDLVATASDNMSVCMGTTPFDVTATGPVTVVVHLTCGIPAGSITVTATTNICPVVDSLEASPGEARVGGHVVLTTAAHDSDNGPSPLAYKWLANGALLRSQTQPTMTFTCTTPGQVTIASAPSDGDPACTDSLAASVTCSP